jgi:hypothetical protein
MQTYELEKLGESDRQGKIIDSGLVEMVVDNETDT